MGMKIGAALMQNSMKFPQKIKNWAINTILILYDTAISFLDVYPKELKLGSHRDIYNPFFTAALFTIVNRGNTQMSTDT